MKARNKRTKALAIRPVAGTMGDADLIVETENSTYFINSGADIQVKGDGKEHTLIWETDAKGRITGAVEMWMSSFLFNGRRQEELVGSWGDSKALVAYWG